MNTRKGFYFECLVIMMTKCLCGFDLNRSDGFHANCMLFFFLLTPSRQLFILSLFNLASTAMRLWLLKYWEKQEK